MVMLVDKLIKLTLALKTIAYYIEIDSEWSDWQRSEIQKAVENALGIKLTVGSVNQDLHPYLKED